MNCPYFEHVPEESEFYAAGCYEIIPPYNICHYDSTECTIIEWQKCAKIRITIDEIFKFNQLRKDNDNERAR